jgi:hypothetical protein
MCGQALEVELFICKHLTPFPMRPSPGSVVASVWPTDTDSAPLSGYF